MRKFEKISFNEFKKNFKDNKALYDAYSIPKRSTCTSAGYDFYAIEDYTIKPGEIKIIPTGIKVIMNTDEMLMLVVRSSMGFKYNVRLCNQIGIIESDYYNNETNEGHMFVCLQNEGSKEYNIRKGDKYLQGIFTKFLTVDDDEKTTRKRKGGFGSTNGEDDK